MAELQWFFEHSASVYDDGGGPIGKVLQHQRKADAHDPIFVATKSAFRGGERTVLCIRGTESFSDVLTNLRAAPEPPLEEKDIGEGHAAWVHFGMWQSSKKVLSRIQGEPWFEGIRAKPTETLYLTGHSLGAGTAALLLYGLKQGDHYESSAPPPCVSSVPNDILSHVVMPLLFPRRSFSAMQTVLCGVCHPCSMFASNPQGDQRPLCVRGVGR